jgi:serine/threonine protein kinase/Tol biopolymer transport system component
MIRRESHDPARWARLSRLFDELADLPPEGRRAGLRRLEAEDPDLAPYLARLLSADATGRELLDRPLELAPVAIGPEEEAGADSMPERAGLYRIVGRLGRGGSAEVFAGERDDGAFEQRVAIKILRRGLDTDDLLARFARERQILARLEHPAISRLLDAGRLADGRPFLVMERVDGRPIHRFASERDLSVEARLRLLLVACDAVAFAHRNLVVHRDLKPSNVLVTDAGEVKLLDFGIAKLLTPEPEAGSPPTAREQRALTPVYAAPEQLAGEATTTATDVWGLGALAFELLVHEPPHRDAPAPAGLAAFAPPVAPPPRPSARLLERSGRSVAGRREAARLAGDLDLVVGKALRLDPAERYSSVEAFADDLRFHLAGLPVRARPASLLYRSRKFAGRHRGAVTAAALVATSLAIGAAVALWQARAAARERARPLPVARFLTYSGQDGSPAVSSDGETLVFRSRRDGRSRIWRADFATGDERPLTTGEDDHPRLSPDGSEVLFTRREGSSSSLFFVPLRGGEAQRGFSDALFGDFAPEGRRIALVRQAAGANGVESILEIGQRHGGETCELARLGGRALHPPRWSPDGRTIAVTTSSFGIGQESAVALVDAASGRVRAVPVAGSSPRGLAWSGANALVYSQSDTVLGWVTGGSSHVLLHGLAGQPVRSVLSSPTSIAWLDVAGAGRLAYTSGSFRVNLRELDLEPGAAPRARRWLTHGASSDRQPSFSPDGRTVVFSSNRGGNLDLWLLTLESGAARRVTHDPALDWDPRFTADGGLLWSSNRDGSFGIWRAEGDGSNAVRVGRGGGDAENPGITPDGRFIVYASGDPALRGIVRMRADGAEPTLLVAGEVFLPELSPDGSRFAYLDLGGEPPALRVASTADGRRLDFQLSLPHSDAGADPDIGRCRWFPDGRSLALLARQADGSYVVERHDLESRAGRAPRATVRFAQEPGYAAESFGISPDGKRMVVAYWDTTSNLMLAENVPGVDSAPGR